MKTKTLLFQHPSYGWVWVCIYQNPLTDRRHFRVTTDQIWEYHDTEWKEEVFIMKGPPEDRIVTEIVRNSLGVLMHEGHRC